MPSAEMISVKNSKDRVDKARPKNTPKSVKIRMRLYFLKEKITPKTLYFNRVSE